MANSTEIDSQSRNGLIGPRPKVKDSDMDPYEYLEEVQSQDVQSFLDQQNQRIESLQSGPEFEALREKIYPVLTAKDQIHPFAQTPEGIVSHFTDEAHPRGILRRQSLSQFLNQSSEWDVLLDVDQLGADEGVEWVLKFFSGTRKNPHRMLLSLSPGGSDASVIREFDTETKSFVDGGFETPASRSWGHFLDKDRLLFADGTDPKEVTDSGFPRQLRVWNRGQKLETSPVLLSCEKSDLMIHCMYCPDQGGDWSIAVVSQSFYEHEYHLINSRLEVLKLPLPSRCDVAGCFEGYLIVQLREDLFDYKM